MKKIGFKNIKRIIPLVLFLVLAAYIVLSARQPTVAGDENTWGTILNGYLSVSLNQNGSINTTTNSTFDANTLFVDSKNHKVGIGTTSPSTKLQLNGQLNMANYSIKAVKGITVANMNVTGQMDRQLNMGGFLITGGVTGANINATLLNSNTILELFANASLAGAAYTPATLGITDLANLSKIETFTVMNTFSGGLVSSGNFNLTGQFDAPVNMGGFLITGGVTGANINATLLNGNTILELFSNASLAGSGYGAGSIGWADLGNVSESETWSSGQTFSGGASVVNLNVTGQMDRQLDMGGFLITGGVTGGDVNATLLNENTVSELYTNLTSSMQRVVNTDEYTTTSNSVYTNVFEYTPPASSYVIMEFFAIERSEAAGEAVVTRVTTSDTGTVGYCAYWVGTTATAQAFDLRTIQDTGGNVETAWLTAGTPTPVIIRCSFVTDATPLEVNLSFKGEATITGEWNLTKGSYYVVNTYPI